MNLLLKFLFIALIILLYFHIYHCFKINPINNITHLSDENICKTELTKEILFKLPIFFNAKNLKTIDNIKKLKKRNIDKNIAPHCDFYNKNLEKIQLLEPNISFDGNSNLYVLKNHKSRINLHENISFRNFYFVKKGMVNIVLIHPRYKDNFYVNNKFVVDKETIEYMKNNDNFIFITLHENSMIYVPNYWMVYIENNCEKKEPIESHVEKISYIPLVNKLNFWYENKVKTKK